MTSKPAIHSATAAPSTNGSQVTSFEIATQPPTGASASTAPRKRWHVHVKRFRYGYTTKPITGIGHSERVTGASCQTATRKTASETRQKPATGTRESSPA